MTRTLLNLLAAGAFATIAFDLFGQALSPLFGYAKLAPVGLANSTLNAVFGAAPKGAGYLVHMLTGLVFYAVGYVFLVRPLWQRFAPVVPNMAVAAIYGVGLWVFALYGVAHHVAGMKPFLGWGGITYVALWGHVVYAVVFAFTYERMNTQPTVAQAV